MSTTITVVGGINEPIIVQLTNRAFDSLSDPVSFDATGKTPSLELRGANGVLVDTSGKVVWEDEDTSTIRFNRLTTDVVDTNGPYRARWFVTEPGLNGIAHPYPSTEHPDLWVVPKTT